MGGRGARFIQENWNTETIRKRKRYLRSFHVTLRSTLTQRSLSAIFVRDFLIQRS